MTGISQPQGGDLLVVDDNRLNREMLTRRLQRKGFTVTEAGDGREALELIDKQRFDLGIFDIMMPGISGLEALVTVRKRYSPAEFPVIMATAKTQTEDIVEALRAGANDYVTKPIDFPVLLARVMTHLNLKRLYKLKDEFLSIASHDLKNPLFVIVCQAYLIQMKVPVGATMTHEAADMVEKIADHAKTMQNLIADATHQLKTPIAALAKPNDVSSGLLASLAKLMVPVTLPAPRRCRLRK